MSVDHHHISASLRSMVAVQGLGSMTVRDLAVAGLAMNVGYTLRHNLEPSTSIDVARTQLLSMTERWLAAALGEIERAAPLPPAGGDDVPIETSEREAVEPRSATETVEPKHITATDAFLVLQLVHDHDVPLAAVQRWSQAERRLAIEWAGAIHLRASDNDDVVVPQKPTCVAAHPFREHTWNDAGVQCTVCGERGGLWLASPCRAERAPITRAES